jgi:Domain of unknown function (DUF4333)
VRSRILPIAMVAATAALLLSSCTFSLTPQVRTVQPDDVANTAEKALEDQVGTRPDIDCGKDKIPLKAKSSITCVLTDPGSGLEYNIVITFSKVTADGYAIDFKVADSPNNQPTPTVSPSDGGIPTVSGDDIAALVVTALSPSLGFPPDVSCPEPQVQIAVDNTTYCQFTDDSGSHDVEVTITSYDPAAGNYSINANVIN